MVKKNKVVFFDRDGVLNKSLFENGKPVAPRKIQNFIINPNSKRVINYLKEMGNIIIVVTNQPDVGNGLVEKKVVDQMNQRLKSNLLIDDIFVCFHSQKDNCNCRKPRTGLFEMAHKKYNVDKAKSFIIGDRFSDIEAGFNFKIKTILLGNGYSEIYKTKPDFKISNLTEIKKII